MLLRLRRRPAPAPAVPAGEHPVSRMMLTTRRFPLHYLPITKCGSTFLKNLLWALDHDAPHPEPRRIHEPGAGLLRAGDLDPAFIRAGRFRFVVLRDPTDRLISLWLDKIWGEGPQNFPELRRAVAAEAGLALDPGLTAEGHVANLLRLAEWLGANLAGQGAVPVNPHWRRQSSRLRRAAAMDPVPLVLDGLAWQLPAFLGPAIPDLAARLALVAERNAAPAPVPRAALRTPALVRAAEAVYREDAERVAEARALWERRRRTGWENRDPARVRPAAGERGLRVLTTHRHAIHTLPVPKAGCTWLRNLFYLLDHGRPHPDPLGIQADGCLVTARVTRTGHGERGFLVLRDPVARFFSLYADKVIGTGPHAFPWIAEALAERRGFHRGRRLSRRQHRENCARLLDYIARRMAREGEATNPHWRPQAVKAAKARAFGFRALTLEGLADQLPRHLGGLVPDLGAAMARLPPVNASGSARARAAVLTDGLERDILALYAADRDLHARAARAWAQEGRAPPV